MYLTVGSVFHNLCKSKSGVRKDVNEGHRTYFIDNKDTEIDLSAIASKYGFFNMNGAGKSKYRFLTNY